MRPEGGAIFIRGGMRAGGHALAGRLRAVPVQALERGAAAENGPRPCFRAGAGDAA